MIASGRWDKTLYQSNTWDVIYDAAYWPYALCCYFDSNNDPIIVFGDANAEVFRRYYSRNFTSIEMIWQQEVNGDVLV